MKTITLVFLIFCLANPNYAQPKSQNTAPDTLVFHVIKTDKGGGIVPWYNDDPAISYNHVLNLVWNYWKNIPVDSTGQKHYMNHQVYKPGDKRGLGGDQLMMALSSWDLYYNYSGDQSVIENMIYIADYYLNNSLSTPDCKWPNLPYPYNTKLYSGKYDGDMRIGKGYLQPDKAGSFGFELVKLYKKTGNMKYLEAATKIANTLAKNVKPGDINNSPWPFKVNAKTGESGILREEGFDYQGKPENDDNKQPPTQKSVYTTNWTGALNLFSELISLKKENSPEYKKAFDIAFNWLIAHPLKTNKWGPFFEDITGWSDTQINAVTFAMFLLENPQLDKDWKQHCKSIFDWVHKELGNPNWSKYKVIPINEQTAYRVPGNSHTSREAATELLFAEKTGDKSYIEPSIRQLNWATYMVNYDGANKYYHDDIWLTDGFGDYVRHYLRAMAALPTLAPPNENHLLRSSSIISSIQYGTISIKYKTFDNQSVEKFRLVKKPATIKVNGNILKENSKNYKFGWSWSELEKGGVLYVNHEKGNEVVITF